jgi:hypothetical protein
MMKSKEDYLAEIKRLEEQLSKSKALGEELRNNILMAWKKISLRWVSVFLQDLM